MTVRIPLGTRVALEVAAGLGSSTPAACGAVDRLALVLAVFQLQ